MRRGELHLEVACSAKNISTYLHCMVNFPFPTGRPQEQRPLHFTALSQPTVKFKTLARSPSTISMFPWYRNSQVKQRHSLIPSLHGQRPGRGSSPTIATIQLPRIFSLFLGDTASKFVRVSCCRSPSIKTLNREHCNYVLAMYDTRNSFYRH